MGIDSAEQRDEATERRAYLQRLRERAVERMRADELAFSPQRKAQAVSRRESLRWLGMAAVTVVPAVAALVRTDKALAAEPLSSRSGAPQYGAPSWYAPREPYPAPPVQGKVTMSRNELGNVKNWHSVYVDVASEKRKSSWTSPDRVAVRAMEGYYSDGWGGGTNRLVAVADPDSEFAYIVRGDQSFYTVVDSDMVACMVGPGAFLMSGSLFRKQVGEDGVAGMIADFAQVSDQEASQRERQGATINLEAGLPQAFWVRNGDIGWELNGLYIALAQRRGEMLELTLKSNGYPSQATFTLNLQSRKLVRTKFEGKEWAP